MSCSVSVEKNPQKMPKGLYSSSFVVNLKIAIKKSKAMLNRCKKPHLYPR